MRRNGKGPLSFGNIATPIFFIAVVFILIGVMILGNWLEHVFLTKWGIVLKAGRKSGAHIIIFCALFCLYALVSLIYHTIRLLQKKITTDIWREKRFIPLWSIAFSLAIIALVILASTPTG